MAKGPRKHMKRITAPKRWYLGKLGGVWAPKPSNGPHAPRESLPLSILLRNKLKYALNYKEVQLITMQRLIKVDHKVRTDVNWPCGFMDIVQIEKTKENFRLLFDTKGRFAIHKVHTDEAAYKLCRVDKHWKGFKGVYHITTHDRRCLRFVDPRIREHDTVRIDLATGEILDHIKFEVGNVCMIKGGNNIGRVGTIVTREKHPGSFEIIHLQDAAGNQFATRLSNVFVIGEGEKPWVSLPKGNGIKLSIIEDRAARLAKQR
mmetsp:Transcript_37358/g.89858  ORF Transcript_37358/g.89858 Transcript_37358/m.89858 type:complete len:261 (+) Transcript_37358:84-866(+)